MVAQRHSVQDTRREPLAGFETIAFTAEDLAAAQVQAFLVASGVVIDDAGDARAARVRGVRLEGCLIAHARVGPSRRGRTDDVRMTWSRARGSARRRCVFVFVASGGLGISSDGVHFASGGGGLGLVAPGAEEVVFTISGEAELLFFSFDASEIEPMVLEAESLRALPGHSVVFRAAYSYLIAAASSPAPDHPASLDVFRSLTRDVARSLVMESNPRGSVSDLVDRAREIMMRRFWSPSFTSERLAAELTVSRRSLERAFSRRGMRVSDELRRVRAHHALHLLEKDVDMPIEEIASVCGFGTQENLRRATVKYFGASPTVIRRGGAQTAAAST